MQLAAAPRQQCLHSFAQHHLRLLPTHQIKVWHTNTPAVLLRLSQVPTIPAPHSGRKYRRGRHVHAADHDSEGSEEEEEQEDEEEEEEEQEDEERAPTRALMAGQRMEVRAACIASV